MTITKMAIPRRTVLRGIGATLALPLLDSMVPAFARAAVTRPPRRLGVVYVPNGIAMGKWTPAAQGLNFEFTPTLKPLETFRDQLLVVSGTDTQGGSAHAVPCTAFLTDVVPRRSDASDLFAGPSMDQLIAAHLGKETQLNSLEIGLDSRDWSGACNPGYSCAYTNTIAWRSPTTPLPMENNPRAVFERLFGDSGTTDPVARRASNALDRSILDSVIEAAGQLRRRLGPQDQAKVEEYLEAVRSIEQRIQLAEQQSARELPVVDQPAGVPDKYSEHAKLMFDLEVLAYQCDLTRVITMMMAREIGGRTYPEIEVYAPHHPTSHHGHDPAKIALLEKVNHFHVSLFAYYVDKLKSTSDGDGSLLDHMVLLYGAGISDGDSHSPIDLPTVLLGGRDFLRGGRHLRFPNGTPRANLHLSMMHLFGMPIEKIGNSVAPLTL